MTTTNTETAARPRTRRVQAVDHAIDVLDTLADAGSPVGLTAIAEAVGLSKATVHHLLATLEARRLVARAPDGVKYQLSWALYELGMHVTRTVDLARVARPFLDDLAARTGESALLAINDADAVLYLDRGDAPTGFRMVASAGRRSPLHATASGKVLLAFDEDPDLWDRIASSPLKRFTDTTLTTVKQLRAELADVRTRGYATCWQEREVGLCSMAVPLRDYSGKVVASLAIAAPATRLNSDTQEAHRAPLLQAAAHISGHLGYAS